MTAGASVRLVTGLGCGASLDEVADTDGCSLVVVVVLLRADGAGDCTAGVLGGVAVAGAGSAVAGAVNRDRGASAVASGGGVDSTAGGACVATGAGA